MQLHIEHNESRFLANAPVCGNCPARKGKGAPCQDGVDAVHHANAGYCPLGSFKENLPKPEGWDTLPIIQPRSFPLLGDVVKALAERIGADKAAKWYEKVTGKPCNCPHRQNKLNALDASFRGFTREKINQIGDKMRKWLGLEIKE